MSFQLFFVNNKSNSNLIFRAIPDKGNRAELVLTCLHRGNLQYEQFLGQVTLPLNEMDVYDRPRSKVYKLQSKPGQEKKDKDRGELEVRIGFNVKAGSLTDLNKKEKKGSTLGLGANIGGSLLSIGTLEKRKSLAKFAKSLGSKVHISGKSKKDKYNAESGSNSNSVSSIGSTPGSGSFAPRRFGQTVGDADPGVISEDDDEFVFDNLSHKSSGSSLNVKANTLPPLPPPSPLVSAPNVKVTTTIKYDSVELDSDDDDDDDNSIKFRSKTLPPSKPPRITYTDSTTPLKPDEWETKLYGKSLEAGSTDSLKRRSWDSSSRILSPAKESGETGTELQQQKPVTPNLTDGKRKSLPFEQDSPTVIALPRSATLESIVEKEKEEIVRKEKPEKRHSKLKFYRKSKNDSLEDLKGKRNFQERIIIGHENDHQHQKRTGTHNSAELSQELIKKYDGKSREVNMW